MDDLPILPFEKILSYLSLEDRIRLRAVSRGWRDCIDSCVRVRSLFYSNRPIGFVYGKSRWLSGAFAQNFVGSPRFSLLFDTFGQSIFSNLKHLRLNELKLSPGNIPGFVQTLESLGQLEELAIFRVNHPPVRTNLKIDLSLPMLNSIHLELVDGIERLTLDAPRLTKVKIWLCSKELRLKIVCGESVERLLAEFITQIEVEKLKNLKYFCVGSSRIDSTLLSTLKQLKEISLQNPDDARELLKQKQRLGRVDLKLYLRGLLLNGPEDPLIPELSELNRRHLLCLADHPSRLADEIPFYGSLDYSDIERVIPESNLRDRLTDLSSIIVDRRVQDVDRFLDFLRNFGHIVELEFGYRQRQNLFDRLSDHCKVQKLIISQKPSDYHFLTRLEHLVELYLGYSIDAYSIRKVLEELRFLSWFTFKCNNKNVTIKIEHPQRYQVSIGREKTSVSDVSSAIQFINEKSGGSDHSRFEWIRMFDPTSWFRN